MKEIRWCVIGAGGIADRRTIPAINKSEHAKLVAVMDNNPETAEKIGKKYGVPYFTDEEEMLSTVACDAVYIGTPVFVHGEQARVALRHGVATLLEKPITLSSGEARSLVDEFKAAGVQLTIGYMMKKHNLHILSRDMIKGGEIGTPVNVRAQFSCWYPDIPGAWRQTRALGGGGAFMDLGVHAAELIEYILDDEIVEVKAMCATNTFKYEVEDSAIVVFKTKRGTLGHIDVNFNIPDLASESKLEIYGDSGYLIAKGTLSQLESGTLTHLFVPGGDYSALQDRTVGRPTVYNSDGGNLYEKQIDEFSLMIEDGVTDYTYADVAVHIQELTDKIYNDTNK